MRASVGQALLLVALLGARSGADPIKYTLPQLIKIAKERSRAVALTKAERAVRSAQKHEALFQYGPSIDFNYLFTGAPNIQCQQPIGDDTPQARAIAEQQGLTLSQLRQRDCVSTVSPDNGNTVSVLNFNIAGVGMQGDLRITQPLYTFGKIENAVQAAAHGIAASDAQAEVARADVEMQTTRAYWGLKAARTGIETIEDVREKLKPWHDKIQKDLDSNNPQFVQADLFRLDKALYDIEGFLADLHRNAGIALAGLHILCGEDADIDDDELELVEIIDHPMSWYTDEARRHRPELHALDEGIEALRSLSRVQRSMLLPDLAFVGAFSFRYSSADIEDSQSAYQTHANYLGFGVFLALHENIDLGKIARWQHAQADAEVMAAQRMLAFSGFTLEIAQAYNDHEESLRRVEVFKKGQKTMNGWFTSIDQSLDARPNELIEAARNYFDLRLRYFQAIFDSNVNTARLRRATGAQVAR